MAPPITDIRPSVSNSERFTKLYDLSQRTMCDARGLADSIAALVESLDIHSIFDCAAGTGIPSLELRKLGIDVYCSDGDPHMVERFKANACKLGVSDQCEAVLWEDLAKMDLGKYDMLVCQGNSLVYNNAWHGEKPDSSDIYIKLFRNFQSLLNPQGYLYIDAPWSRPTPEATMIGEEDAPRESRRTCEVEDRGISQLEVIEVVHELEHVRMWDCSVTTFFCDFSPPQTFTFVRYSAKVDIYDFEKILASIGFRNFQIFQNKASRSNHGTLICQKS